MLVGRVAHFLGAQFYYSYLALQTTSFLWMFGEPTIFHGKIWNQPIETTIYKGLALEFQVVM